VFVVEEVKYDLPPSPLGVRSRRNQYSNTLFTVEELSGNETKKAEI
jgi:hypothetical protein